MVSVQRLTSVMGLPPTIRNKFIAPCNIKFETNKYKTIIVMSNNFNDCICLANSNNFDPVSLLVSENIEH